MKSLRLLLAIASAISSPAAAATPEPAPQPVPLAMSDANKHDFLCHEHMYRRYEFLLGQHQGASDAGQATYAMASYFIGKLVGRNGDNFSVAADVISDLDRPYARAEDQSQLLLTCIDEYNAVFGKIEQR